jgi:putative inorganic carbon (hco3(-)) transporter
MPLITDAPPHPAGRRRSAERAIGPALQLGTLILCLMVLVLPLMMGHRTPETLTASLMVMTVLALAAAALTSRDLPAVPAAWMWIAGAMSVLVVVQVWPSTTLARLFGPYPDELWQHPTFSPAHWSPDPGATLRGWAAFIALLAVAWMGRSLPGSLRHWVWLAIVAMALFQGLYGLLSHAAGAQSIFGIWERNNPGFVHGSFSNRNLYAAYLALTWPLAVGIWYVRGVPGISRLPVELRIAASVICAAIIGAAMLGSASRLGSAAGVFGIVVALIMWGRHRRIIHGASVWPVYCAAAAALVAAIWYGLTPLAERLLATTGEEMRLEAFGIMISEFPRQWWLHGVGLGGFEAAFKPFQPAHVTGWLDYAHNDLLQWLIEMGLPGLAIMLTIAIALLRKHRLTTERIALYAGLAALCIVALGDFSWHIPATQVVLAFYVGVLLR